MIRFQCPKCQRVLQVPDTMAGSVASCGQCRQALRVPMAAAVATPPPLPPPPPRIEEPVGPEISSDEMLPDPLTQAAASRRRKPRGTSKGLVVAVVAGMVGLVGLAGGAYVLWGPPEERKEPVAERKEKKAPPAPVPDRKTRPEKPPERVVEPEEKTPLPERKTPLPDAALARLSATLVEKINQQRQLEGAPELTLHEGHSRGCLDHALYLARHEVRDAHDQDRTLPGATDAGREAARVASIVFDDANDALRAWLAAPAHRAWLTDPALRSVGIGLASSKKDKPICVFDFVRGRPTAAPSKGPDPVVYPAPVQNGVPLAFPGREVPDPLPMNDDKLAGYPITITFPSGVRVPESRAWLEDESGANVPVWFSSPTRPANENFVRNQQNTICLFAKEILRPGTRYLVRIEAQVGGQDWTRVWTFTTQPADEWQNRIRDLVLPRLNLHRKAAGLEPATLDEDLSRVCVLHARYLTRNVGRVPDLRFNEQKSGLPGFTEEGQRMARDTSNFQGKGVEPITCIEQMLSTVRYRLMVLNPHQQAIGLGADLHPPAGWFWVLHLPPVPNRMKGPIGIPHPGEGQEDVPLLMGEPVGPLVKDVPPETQAGYPITASFALTSKVRESAAKLFEADGTEVPCWLSTPEAPLPGVGPFRQLALIPKKPLKAATRYRAEMSAEVDGKPWSRTWQFTTVDPAREEERVAKGLLGRLNAVRLIAGLPEVTLDEKLSRPCRLHAEYVVRNIEHPKVQDMGIHDEDPMLPGYTKEGAKAGEVSVIALLPDPSESVDSWMATFYHRLPLLHPRLNCIGYGQAFHPSRGWVTVMDANSGSPRR